MSTLSIRLATAEDASAVAAIYAHYVFNGTASFDYEPRSLSETNEKIETATARNWPILVAIRDAQVVGYAHATQFRDQPAYSFACENSVYFHPRHIRQGVGNALLAALLTHAQDAGFRQMIAVIGGGEPGSVALHTKQGFSHAGQMRSVGRKFERWLDTIYMQAPFGSGDSNAPRQEPEV